MKRRDFIINTSLFALLVGIGLDACTFDRSNTGTIKELVGKLDRKKLIFLLRRATLGFSEEQLSEFENLSTEAILEKLLDDSPVISFPLNFEFKEDRTVPIGRTWIEAPYRTDVFYEQYRKKSLRAWLTADVFENKCSLRQQMQFFWLNFYAISDVIEHKYEHRHARYFHNHAFGNFKKITKDVTIDPAMLRFLSGFENTKESPNENYARELLELYTIGRGELAGKGDYTTFTEKDVKEISRILTGWRDTGWFAEKIGVRIDVRFEAENHFDGDKVLSHRFENKIIKSNAEAEYKDIIDLIFTKRETASHFTRRLYRWFCCDEITEQAEKEVILPLAKLLIDSNFEVKPVLVALLSSEHFYELSEKTARLKNPLQYTFDLLNFFPVAVPKDVTLYYTFWVDIFETMMKMGMELLKPPSVGGWKAYYQAPGYSKLWINSAALKNKSILIDKITSIDPSWEKLGVNIDHSKIVLQSKASQMDELLDYINQLFFMDNLSSEIIETAKKILKNGVESNSDQEILQELKKGNLPLVTNFRNMLNYLFKLPMINIQ